MNLNGKDLCEWLKDYDDNSWFYSSYDATFKRLRDEYYDQIETGAQIEDECIQLNNHGVTHVNRVLEHASKLVEILSIDLKACEVYVLLICILFHDVGNMFGRSGHESNTTILDELEQLYCRNKPEKITIQQIINAHGGVDEENDKDKISSLENERGVFSSSVRMQLLAAILRFADELADDSERASRGLLRHKRISKESKIHHCYSESLQTPRLYQDRIELQYYINEDYIIESIDKFFLIDVIYARIYKMHLERAYCSRYWNPQILIDRICVNIDFIQNEAFLDKERVTFDVYDIGYPNFGDSHSLFEICPSLSNDEGKKKDGHYYQSLFSKRRSEQCNSKTHSSIKHRIAALLKK